MTAIASPGTLRSTLRSSRAGCWSAVLLVPLLAAIFAVEAQEPQEDIAAVWKVKEISFSYRPNLTEHSCYEIESRVAAILMAVGARDDVKVRVSDCDVFAAQPEPVNSPWRTTPDRYFFDRSDRPSDRQPLVHVRVRLQMPTEVTPDVLADLEKDKTRRDLVSRVTGDPSRIDTPVMFPARRQSVTLSRRTAGLEPEDCELLDQMSTSVFRRLDVRVLRRGYSCDRNEVSRISPQLTVETLMGVPFGTPGAAAEPEEEKAEEKPAAAGQTTESGATPESAATESSEPKPADESKPAEPERTDAEPASPPQ